MGNIEQVNAYQVGSGDKSAIKVITVPSGSGWVTQVLFPKRAPSDDRTKLLNWLMSYREQIKSQYPSWDVSFRAGENTYWLIVTPVKDHTDLKRFAREKANLLFNDIVSPYAR
jgi:hypothetical protein